MKSLFKRTTFKGLYYKPHSNLHALIGDDSQDVTFDFASTLHRLGLYDYGSDGYGELDDHIDTYFGYVVYLLDLMYQDMRGK